MKPRLSICIPAYGSGRFLEETLASVKRQSFRDWEVVVTEDGSNGGIRGMVEAFADEVDRPVRYTRHDANLGLPATRNTGIRSAEAGWIALLDSDDLWTPEHLERLVAAADSTGAELVHAGSILFDSESGRRIEVRAPDAAAIADFPRSLFVAEYIIQPASVLMRRELWDRVGGFDPAFRYVEDREMWLRCARAGAKFAYTGSETCLYRKHGGALSTRAAEMAEAAAAVLDRHLDWEAIPAGLRRRKAAEGWAAAGRLRQRAHPAIASGHFRRACAIEWRWAWWLRGVLCGLLGRVRDQPAGDEKANS